MYKKALKAPNDTQGSIQAAIEILRIMYKDEDPTYAELTDRIAN